jgi:3-hydroxy-9,10-secoandrosta-1,3,5(10)-triene-9,17-dione monooxygenase reductase component
MTAAMSSGPSSEIPEGMNPDARSTWPSRELIDSFLGTGLDFELRLGEHTPVGMTCQSFSSVSLEPPLVMFCPAKTSRAWPLMRKAGFFCVNFLAADQQDISNGMATKGAEKFAGVGWKPASTGAPLIDGVLGYVDCTIDKVHEAGDHYIVVGRVEELAFGDGDVPLLFHRGAYTQPE